MGMLGGKVDSSAMLKHQAPTEWMRPILEKFRYIIDNKSFLKKLSTPHQLVIISDLLAASYSCDIGMNDVLKKKYENFFNFEWKIFSHFASLISYNYSHDEKSIRFPLYHKLIIASLDNIISVDIPEIYEMLCQIFDIEMHQVNTSSLAISEKFQKRPELLSESVSILRESKNLNRDASKLGFKLQLVTLNQVCRITSNYYNLKSILKITAKIKGYNFSSYMQKIAFLGNLIKIGELIKKLTPDMKRKINTINWKVFEDIRDCLEHPDEAGRLEVTNKLLNDNLSHTNFSMIQSQIEELEININLYILERFYQEPGLAFLEDRENKLIEKPLPITGYTIADKDKLSAKEKDQFYKLILVKNKEYWQKVFTGCFYFTDEAILFLEKNVQLIPFVEKIRAIEQGFIAHMITKWERKFNLPKTDIQAFLAMATAIKKREICIQMLEQGRPRLSSYQINELVQDIEKMDKSECIPIEAKIYFEKSRVRFRSASFFFHSVVVRITDRSPMEILFNTFKAISEMKCVDDLNPKEIVALTLQHTDKIKKIISDCIHTPEFRKEIFLYTVYSVLSSASSLSLFQLEILKDLLKQPLEDLLKQPLENLSEEEQHKFMDVLVRSGILEACKRFDPTLMKQAAARDQEFFKKYSAAINAKLLSDPNICDAFYYYLNITFGLIKKILEIPGIIPKEFFSILSILKTSRNFLGHLDDYIGDILYSGGQINIRLNRISTLIFQVDSMINEANKTLSRQANYYRFSDEENREKKQKPHGSSSIGLFGKSMYAQASIQALAYGSDEVMNMVNKYYDLDVTTGKYHLKV